MARTRFEHDLPVCKAILKSLQLLSTAGCNLYSVFKTNYTLKLKLNKNVNN